MASETKDKTKEEKFLEFEPELYESIKVPFGFFDYQDIYKTFLLNIKDTQSSDPVIVEIGSWVGKSTCYMAELIRYFIENKLSNAKKREFINIDPFVADCIISDAGAYTWVESTPGTKLSTKAEFIKNTEGLRSYIKTREEYSPEAASKFADKSIDCVWIDALHDYASVLKDLEAWWVKVKDGGILAGHDFTYDFGGVPKAVNDFCIRNGLTYTVKHKSFLIIK